MTQQRVSGTLSLHPKGFGFLNFEQDEESRSAFVAPPDLNPYLEGDEVEATLKKGKDGRFSAHDLSLVKRTRTELFGKAIKRGNRVYLQTDREVANTDWPMKGQTRTGSYYICTISNKDVVPTRRLEGDADLPLERLIARFGLRTQWGQAAEAQLKEILSQKHKLGARRDLRKTPTVTIDAPSTKDLDDAVSVLPADSDGAVRLLVSIADPAEFISPGSPLDDEARARGTSTYLADRVLPMLPHALSSDHLSLRPGEDRCCLTVELRIDPEGDTSSVDIYESLIRSHTRLSYSELAGWLDYGDMTPELEKVEEILPWLRTAAARLSVARRRRGGVNMSGNETAEVELDDSGNVAGTSPSATTSAHMLIERFMVAANEAVASWLTERGLPGVFRVHPEPDSSQVEVLADCARKFGYEPGFGKRLTPGSLASFDAQIVGDAAEPAIRSVLRGVLEPARYTVFPGLHLGLGSPLYLHFTSPLRRYADLAVHRLIKDYLQGKRPQQVEDPKVEELGQHLNDQARVASKAESLRRRMLLAEYMTRHIGEEFDAYITRVLPFGLVAQLQSSLVEGLIPAESIPDGPYESTKIRLIGPNQTFTLGMPVRVKVVSTEPEMGRLEYALA